MTPERQERCGGKPGEPFLVSAADVWPGHGKKVCPGCPDCTPNPQEQEADTCPTCKGPKDKPGRVCRYCATDRARCSNCRVCTDPFHDSPPPDAEPQDDDRVRIDS